MNAKDDPGNLAAEDQSDRTPQKSFAGLLKLFVLLAVATLFGFLYSNYHDQLTPTAVASRETEFQAYGREHPVLIVGIAFVVYVTVTGLSLPGASVLTITFGWFFKLLFGKLNGYLFAVIFTSFASTSGATLAFLLSRYLFRDTIQHKFGHHLTGFNKSLEREGAFYLFTLRLIFVVPFFVINMVMGLTPLRLRTFWWVSQLGMLPGTCVFVYAGWAVPSLQELAVKLEEQGVFQIILTPDLIAAFVLLGIFPIAVKKIIARFRPAEQSAD